MYRSILEKTDRPVTPDAFAEVPALMFNHYVADERVSEQDLLLWDQHIGHDPADIYRILTGGYDFDDDVLLKINLFETGRMDFQIDHAGDEAFVSHIAFMNKQEIENYSSKVKVAPEAQGMGIGRISMRNWIELSAALGLQKFTFEAGFDNGAYTWAKMGAHLDRDGERWPYYEEDERELSKNMIGRLKAARPFLRKADYDDVFDLCMLSNADDLVKLTSFDYLSVPIDVLDDANKILSAHYAATISNTSTRDVRIREQCDNLRKVFNVESGAEDYVSLPHYLQKWTTYSAVVDFSNDAQMEQVGEYVYGWWSIECERAHAPVSAVA